MTTPTPALSTWRVLIQFQETKLSYMVHRPSEEQQRGYHKDKLYPDITYAAIYHLILLTDAIDEKRAKAKARQLLLEYVRES
jgi:hypothetical protein